MIVRKKIYPNGSEYLDLIVDNVSIGHVVKCTDGYLARGKQKPVQTLFAAAKQLLDTEISRKTNELDKLKGKLRKVLNDKWIVEE
jgi:hypothetical protein